MDAPRPEPTPAPSQSWTDVDRRNADRAPCCLAGIAKSVTQSLPQVVSPGGSFPITVSDLSASGARLTTPHELGVGDELMLTVDAPADGQAIHRPCRVVWVGLNMDEVWCAGVEFTDPA